MLLRPSRNRLPFTAAFSIIPSSTSTRRAVRATAQASGLPPKVEPCWPGFSVPSTALFESTAEPGLDLIENQHHIVRGAELAHLCEVAGRRDDDARFPLDGLDEECDGVRRDRLLQRLGVTEGDYPEARRERSKMFMCGRVGAEADDTERASVEVV